MTIYHHNGDNISTDFSPKNAFFFTRLKIEGEWGSTASTKFQLVTEAACLPSPAANPRALVRSAEVEPGSEIL
jgi:hypothetical protein